MFFADKKNKRPFGVILAAPCQPQVHWQGGAGWGGERHRGVLGDSRLGQAMPHRQAHTQPYAPFRHGAHRAPSRHACRRGLRQPSHMVLGGNGQV